MALLITGLSGGSPQIQPAPSQNSEIADSQLIASAADLLDLYLASADNSAVMPLLQKLRDDYLEDLDQIDSPQQIYGLLYWLMRDQGVEHQGESLEETADRLGDIDIANDSDQYTQLIFHLKDAVERLYDLELDA